MFLEVKGKSIGDCLRILKGNGIALSALKVIDGVDFDAMMTLRVCPWLKPS